MLQSCRGAGTFLAAPIFGKLAFADPTTPISVAPGPQFHLNPRYRSQLPLDVVFLKVEPGSDEFVSEKYAEQIGMVLQSWSSALREPVRAVETIGKFLANDFSGVSPLPAEARQIRTGLI
ncbi:MAG TPA: hypothetical protein VJ731_01710, partial [Terriglobales bacterium]|nr:hypothetical protein [Terriglobales bacterium]